MQDHGDGGKHTDHGKLSRIEDRLRDAVFLLCALFQHHSHQETAHDDRQEDDYIGHIFSYSLH